MIFRQPNGLYGRVSRIVEAPTHQNMTVDELKAYITESRQWDYEDQTLEEWLELYEVSFSEALKNVSNMNLSPADYLKWLSEIY